LRFGSFLANSHLSLIKIVDIIYWWTVDTPNHVVQLQLGIDDKTTTDWLNFLRDVCSADLLANPIRLGGPGHTVAIDESVVARRQRGNQQERAVNQQCVFGGVDLGTKDFFIELVPRVEMQRH